MSRKIYGLTEVIDGSLLLNNGNLLIGTDDVGLGIPGFSGSNIGFRVAADGSDFAIPMITYAGTGTYPALLLGKSRGSNTSLTQSQSGDVTGQLYFTSYGDTQYQETASIESRTTQTTTDSGSGGDLRFRTTLNGSVGSTTRMLIDQDGQVGIGTTNPSYLFHVQGQSYINGTLGIKTAPNTAYGISLSQVGGANNRGVSVTLNSTQTFGQSYANYTTLLSSTSLGTLHGYYSTNNATIAGNTIMFSGNLLADNGNHYGSSINATGDANQTAFHANMTGTGQNYGGFFAINGTGTLNTGLHIALSAAATTNTGLYISTLNGTTNNAIEVAAGHVIFNNASGEFDFRVESNNDQHMLFVDGSTDRVGIGVSSPASVLDVDGMLSVRGAVGSQTLGPHTEKFLTGQSQPVYQNLIWNSDNISFGFGLYYNAGWKSGDAGSNFQIYKEQDALKFNYDTGITLGSSTSMNGGFALTNDGKLKIGGFNQIGTVAASAKLHVVESLGTIPTLPAGTVALFQNNQATANNSAICILGGAVVNSQIFFGDANDADVGRIEYNHIQNDIQFTTNGVTDNGPNINQYGTLNTNGHAVNTRYNNITGTSFTYNLTSNDEFVVGRAVGGRFFAALGYQLPDVATDGLVDGQVITFRTLEISTGSITISSGTGGAIMRNLNGVDVSSQACSANLVYKYIWQSSLGRWVQIL